VIGVFGGTFDPVHHGHLRTALEVTESLGLDEMRLVPCSVPPHRGRPRAPGALRLGMLEAAVAPEPRFRVDGRELQRPGPSYMYDTLASMRSESATVPLCLVIGSDALRGFESWHRWEEILDLAHLVVVHRPGWELDGSPAGATPGTWARDRRARDAAELRASPGGRLLTCQVTQLDISASTIRGLLAQGRSPRYLLPEAVLAIIRDAGIYATGAAEEAARGR